MKLLVILSRFPFPLQKGDKLRAFHQIRHLSQHNEIILFTLNEEPVPDEHLAQLQPYCSEIVVHRLSKFKIGLNIVKALFSDLPLQVGYFYDSAAREKLQQLVQKHQPDMLYCQLLRTVPYALNFPEIPKSLDYQDVFSAGMERRLHTDPFYLKPILKLEFERLVQYERHVFDRFDVRTIISEQDRELIHHPHNGQIHIIPNGVDTDFYYPISRPKQYDLLFTGNMSYPPNIMAVVFLSEQVLPLVRNQYPGVKLLIAGATPAVRVKALASAGVEVTGWVDDIRDCYASSRIFIAPMQIGTGLQNKLLEAMAMQLPCITSRLANNALGATPDQEILIGETPQDYANHIHFLLSDTNKAKKLAEKGQQFVRQNFNWQSTTLKLQQLMEQALKPVKI